MKLAVLSLLLTVSCADLSLDPGRESGAAGSVAVLVEALTSVFTVPNSNGAADYSANNDLNLIRLWVLQYTNAAHYQPTEWSCSNYIVNVCQSNFGLPTWALNSCASDVGGAWKCRLLKGGTDVGWASRITNQNGTWYAQFNADGRSANGQPSPLKLTVVR